MDETAWPVQANELRHDLLGLLDAADGSSGLNAEERAFLRAEAVGVFAQMIDARTGAATRTTTGQLENRLYTADEAAAFLRPRLPGRRRVSAATVRQWAREGRLEAGWGRSVGGRGAQWRISPRSLRRAVEQGLPPAGTYDNPYCPDQQARDHCERLLD